MKRISSLLFLSLFLFNSIGYYFVFLLSDSNNREEIRHSLSKDASLEIIRIHRSELATISFKDNGKEFSLHGEMYDLKSRSEKGDFIFLVCMHDKKETQLLAGLDAHVKYTTDSKSPTDKKQNNSSKNPVKDLFLNTIQTSAEEPMPAVFPSYLLPLTSYISPTLPLPPPEVSIA